MSTVPTVTFTGVSGKKYDFKVYPKNTKFPNIGAIYILSKRTVVNGQGSHELLYIGETEELGSRLSNHEKWPCVNRLGCNVVCVKTQNDRRFRLAIEADIRKKYDPPCNDQ